MKQFYWMGMIAISISCSVITWIVSLETSGVAFFLFFFSFWPAMRYKLYNELVSFYVWSAAVFFAALLIFVGLLAEIL